MSDPVGLGAAAFLTDCISEKVIDADAAGLGPQFEIHCLPYVTEK